MAAEAGSANAAPLVVVTGASGFIGGVVAAYALAAGWRVRCTVRNAADEKKTASLKRLRGPDGSSVEIVSAELSSPAGWPAAVAGATYILHVASPFPQGKVNNGDKEVVEPAVQGVQHVLEAAAAESSVKRVVLTSSIAALNNGRFDEWDTHEFTEADWANEAGKGNTPYAISKIRSEKAAIEFVEKRKPAFTLVRLNPVLVVGPPATSSAAGSTTVITRLLMREMPAVPSLQFVMVDVRDVAVAHLRAMTAPDAAVAGQRFILAGGVATMADVAKQLDAEFGCHGYSVPTGKLPTWLVKTAAMLDGALAIVTPQLDKKPLISSAHASAVLGFGGPTSGRGEARAGWRDVRAACTAEAYGLIAQGIVPDKSAGGFLRAGDGAAAAAAAKAAGRAPPPYSVAALQQYSRDPAAAAAGVIAPADLEGVRPSDGPYVPAAA